MDGMKNLMEVNMFGLKVDMEGWKEGSTKLLQERLPSCDKVIHENHDEDTMNMNCDFRNSNFRFKNHHIPMIDMRKFHGKVPVTWILQLERYVYLHDVHDCNFIFRTQSVFMILMDFFS